MWDFTSVSGFAVEDYVARLHNLTHNENERGTDLFRRNPKGRVYVEVKHIMPKYIKWEDDDDGVRRPLQNYFTVTRQAYNDSETCDYPVLRPGGVFRTCHETPGALFVVHCPPKLNQHIPARTHYYQAHQLAARLTALIFSDVVKVTREKQENTKKKFETVVKVPFALLRDIEISETEFARCLRTGCNPNPDAETIMQMWRHVACYKSVPTLRKAYKKHHQKDVDTWLAMDIANQQIWRAPGFCFTKPCLRNL